jgi:hypothetical protein
MYRIGVFIALVGASLGCAGASLHMTKPDRVACNAAVMEHARADIAAMSGDCLAAFASGGELPQDVGCAEAAICAWDDLHCCLPTFSIVRPAAVGGASPSPALPRRANGLPIIVAPP